MTVLQPFPRLARFPVIASLAFILDSKPCSLNDTYGTRAIRSKRDPGKYTAMMYMTPEADARKALITRAATFSVRAQSVAGWPLGDLWAIAHVRMSIYVFNVRAGTDAANEVKLAADACQGVLYRNDNIVSIGEIPRPEKDGTKTPRVEYVFDLLEELAPLDARKRELDHLASRRQDLLSIVSRSDNPVARAVARDEHKEVQAAFLACQAKISALIANPQLH